MVSSSKSESQLYRGESWFSHPNFPLAVKILKQFLQGKIHHHDYHELVIVLSGTASHTHMRSQYSISGGDVFLIKPEVPHSYSNLKDLRLANIMFRPDNLPGDLLDLPQITGYRTLFELEPASREHHQFQSHLHLSVKHLGIAKGMIDTLDQELKRRDTGWRLMALTTLQQLMVFLSRCYERQHSAKTNSLLRISEAITFIETNHQEPLTLDMIAARASMTPRNLNRIFKQSAGFSAIDYLIRYRIEKAVELLSHKTHNITEAAVEVGITNNSYFTRQFKKIMGTTPREFVRSI